MPTPQRNRNSPYHLNRREIERIIVNHVLLATARASTGAGAASQKRVRGVRYARQPHEGTQWRRRVTQPRAMGTAQRAGVLPRNDERRDGRYYRGVGKR